ncbi:MAG: NurA domain superfamily [Chthonomonadaceae bacterium]|nr:NurA domain superfamily [Chthonomonadaceae bacterium]
MGWDFFQSNGGRRAGGSAFPIPPHSEGQETDEETEASELDYETKERNISWGPINACPGTESRNWSYRPARFVDGKDAGQTVAWLRSPEGYPIPVRLGQIGAIVMRNEGGRLVREWYVAERVVAIHVQPFGWEEIEGLARALQQEGFRLLDAPQPYQEGRPNLTFECEPWRKSTQNRTLSEMTRLEQQAIAANLSCPTLVDGRLAPRKSSFGLNDPMVGLIKTHGKPYLQTRRQWEVLYDLGPGQRTPAFAIQTKELRVVSFYVRLCDDRRGESLDSGIVRVELPAMYFEQTLGRDWECLDRFAGLMADYRCRDETYGRAAISIEPIVRAEESLGSLFAQSEALISKFYNRTQL